MSNYKTMLSIGILMLCIVIGITYVTGLLGTLEGGFNVTVSPYQEQYNTTVQASILSFSLAQYFAVILAIILLVSSLLFLKRML